MILATKQDSFIIYPPPQQAIPSPSTTTQEAPSSSPQAPTRLRLTPRDDEVLLFLYTAGYAQTDQIAGVCFTSVAVTSRLRAAQRRLKQLADADFVRALEQPVYPRQRNGARPLVHTLAARGGARVAERLGLHRREIDTRPRPRETNISWLGHSLDLVSYWLALQRACRQTQIRLESWVTDRLMQKQPAKVEIRNDHGIGVAIGVVPDACYVLSMPRQSATCLFEYDRATVTLQPAAWTRKGWRRKVLGLLALAEEGKLKGLYGAETLWVKTVTKNQARMENMLEITANAAGERSHHFWFTTEDQLNRNILTEPIWHVAGRRGTHAVAGR